MKTRNVRLALISNIFMAVAMSHSLTTQSPAQCVLPPPGLVSWWPAEGNAEDIFGGNPGILANGARTTPAGIVGQAFVFDGVDDLIMSASAPLTNIANSFTIEFWVLPTTARTTTVESTNGTAGTTGQRYTIAPENVGGTGPAGVGLSVGTNGISVFEHASSYMPSLLVYAARLTNWTHVALVYDAKRPNLYVNGVLVRTGLMSPRPAVFPSKVFGNVNNYGPFKGFLDEVSIFNRVLTANEIASIYQAGSLGKCRPPQPLPPVVVYSNDFEGAVGLEWSPNLTDVTPVGNRWFLGQFGTNNVTLTLSNLPPHSRLNADFDLFIINTWDGNNGPPDVWEAAVVGGPTLLHTTFQNNVFGQPQRIQPQLLRLQAYPDDYPGAFYPAKTGALESGTLGYPTTDAMYRINLSFPHSESTVQLLFRGSGLQAVTDESWGLDNFILTVDGPSVTLTSPTNGLALTTPTNLLLQADALPLSGTIDRVQFLSDNVLLGTVTSAPYELVWSNVPTGLHIVTVQAFDDSGRVAVSSASVRVNGLRGEFFNNTQFSGTPVLRQDPVIDFDWVGTPPVQQVSGTNFTARWTGTITPRYSEPYTFSVSGDDDFRLWVDGTRVVDDWHGGSTHTRQGTIALEANRAYPVQVDFLQGPGGSNLYLEWQSPHQAREIVPASQLMPPKSNGNRSPNTAVIISPPADEWALDDIWDPLLAADFFSDPDTGQHQTAAEWEIWTMSTTPTELIWHALSTSTPLLLTNHLGNGTFMGSYAGIGHLLLDTNYLLRVRHQDNSGATNAWSAWGQRSFNTRYVNLAASTFDTSLEGWTFWKSLHPELHPDAFEWESAGHPGGCIFCDEYGNGDGDATWYRAPQAFLWNKSGAFGGYLEFDMRWSSIPAIQETNTLIELFSPNGVLELDAVLTPGIDWTHLRLPLSPAGWRLTGQPGSTVTDAQFLGVLSTLTNLLIRADDFTNPDNSYLDNVRIEAQRAVSETFLLIQAGVGATATIEWPTNAVGFQLEATDNLRSGVWSSSIPVLSTVITNGLQRVTVNSSAGQRFYRLRRM